MLRQSQSPAGCGANFHKDSLGHSLPYAPFPTHTALVGTGGPVAISVSANGSSGDGMDGTIVWWPASYPLVFSRQPLLEPPKLQNRPDTADRRVRAVGRIMLHSRRISLGFKLIGSFAALLVLVGALSDSALVAIRGLGTSLDTAVNVTAKKMDLARSMDANLNQMRVHAAMAEISLINSMLVESVTHKDSATGQTSEMVCQGCHTPDKMESNRHLFESLATTLGTQGATLRQLITSPDERNALDTLQKRVTAWAPLYEEYLTLAGQKDFPAAHDIMLGKIYPLVEDIAKSAQWLTAAEEKSLQISRAAADHQVSATFLQVFCFAALALVAGMGGLWIVRASTLTVRQNVHELKEMSSQVASAAEQISVSNQSLAQAASEQAASVEEASASTEEIGALARKNSDNSQTAVQLMLAGSKSIAEAEVKLQQLATSVHEMVAASGKISKIIKAIDEIAFQTNILALNAAVEAARAGESGAGFAVVADEVRNLAGRSAEAARETAQLISEATAQSAASSRKLDEVVDIFRGTTEGILSAKQLIGEVDNSAREQMRGLDHISRAVSQLEQLAMQTAASAEERAAATEELSAQSSVVRDVTVGLEQVIGTRRQDMGGNAGGKRSRDVADVPHAAPRPIPGFVPVKRQ